MELPTHPEDHIDSNKGFLSSRDREYLLKKKSYENDQSEANRRQEIRDKTRMGMLDLMLIAENLPEQDKETLLTDLPDGEPSVESMIQQLRSEGINERTEADEQEYTALKARLLIHDFVERGLVNTGRDPDLIGLFGAIFGLKAKTIHNKQFSKADLRYLIYWLPDDEQLRKEILDWLGFPSLEMVFEQ